MPGSLEQERAAIAADEQRLNERRKKLSDREKGERQKLLAKSVLVKLDHDQLNKLLGRMKSLGLEEVEKRLAA